MPAIAGAVCDVEIGDHVAGHVHHGLNIVAGLDSALLGGHHGAFGVGEAHGAPAGLLQLFDALFMEGDSLPERLRVRQMILVQIQREGMVNPVLMEVVFVHAVQKPLHGLQLRPGVLQLLPAELHAGGLLSAVGRADGRAVQTQRLAVHDLHLPARAREDDKYPFEQLPVRHAEVRDGAEIRLQPVQQKPQFHIPPALPHEIPGGADLVHISIEIQLQQIAEMIRRTARPRGHGVPKPHFLQIQAVHEHLDEPRRAVPRHLVLDAPHAHGHLAAVCPNNKAHKIPSLTSASYICIIRHEGRKSFWFWRVSPWLQAGF